MVDNWRKEQYPDLINFLLGAMLMVSPWAFGYISEGSASWNAVLCGLLVVVLALVALVAFAGWQAWWCLAAGIWIAAAPHVMGFTASTLAARIHGGIGALVAMVSIFRIWFGNDRTLAA